jgi:hypothetical protein
MIQAREPENGAGDQLPGEPRQPAKTRPGVRKLLVRAGAVVLAVAAALLMSALTVDLGPNLKALAERQGSNYLKRPMHIGRLSARLLPGVFVVENLVIEGLSPGDAPFLTASTITVRFPWWSIATKRLVIESVDMTDWNMCAIGSSRG